MAEQQLHDTLLTLDELLNAITGVLDIRDVFDRVSAIARRVLPHDAMIIREMLDATISRARSCTFVFANTASSSAQQALHDQPPRRRFFNSMMSKSSCDSTMRPSLIVRR